MYIGNRLKSHTAKAISTCGIESSYLTVCLPGNASTLPILPRRTYCLVSVSERSQQLALFTFGPILLTFDTHNTNMWCEGSGAQTLGKRNKKRLVSISLGAITFLRVIVESVLFITTSHCLRTDFLRIWKGDSKFLTVTE